MAIFNHKKQNLYNYISEHLESMNVKVLIVEDNPITAQDIEEMLLSRGVVVTGLARNSQQAINKARETSPDVILMDINLDGETDGIDTIKTIHKTDYIPVVYLTANTDDEHVEKAYSTMPAAFLSKPFDEKDLIYAIELAFINHCEQSIVNSAIPEMNKAIFLKNGDRYERVSIENILYIEADGSYSKVFTKDRNYSITLNLYNLSKRINHPIFFRTHRSYIINIQEITGFDVHHVYINDIAIPYSKSYKEVLMAQLHKL